jgi:environmental stress-induced protein Ves
MQTIDRASWREQPWKNGRGTTLEIVRWRLATDIDRRAMLGPVARFATISGPDGRALGAFANTNEDDYDVRVSLADVTASGAFSTFPGYRRHTFLVGPAPITLGDIELVAPGDHIELPGETTIEASLPAGATQLLNVLVRGPSRSSNGTSIAQSSSTSIAIIVGHGPTAHRVLFSFELSTKIARSSATPEAIDSRDSVWIA